MNLENVINSLNQPIHVKKVEKMIEELFHQNVGVKSKFCPY